jgi:hypothetical protein
LPAAARLHAQIAEHLSAPRSQRSELRSRIAAFLDTAPTGNAAQEEETIAFHYERAEQWQAAAQHLFQAGGHANLRQAADQAAAYFQRGLDDLGRLPADQAGSESQALGGRLQSALGDTCLQNGDFARAAAAYEAAIASLPESAPPVEALKLRGKLALVLPAQNRSEEADKLLRQLLEEAPGPAELGLSAALAWVLWRSGKAEAAAWLQRCRELLPAASGPWATGIEILVNDLAGEWAAVKAAYQAQGLPAGAALAAVRLGDQLLRQGNQHAAQGQYEHAAKIWAKSAGAACGLALVSYRQAEALWIGQDTPACHAALDEAQKHLEGCLPAIQAEARELFKQALKAIRLEKKDAWPAWHWYEIDDQLRIQLLFQAVTA